VLLLDAMDSANQTLRRGRFPDISETAQKIQVCHIPSLRKGATPIHEKLEGRLVECIPPPLTLTFDLPKFNHLVLCGQVYKWRSLVTIGLELAPGSCSQTHTHMYMYMYLHHLYLAPPLGVIP